jgi:hypothetical protein
LLPGGIADWALNVGLTWGFTCGHREYPGATDGEGWLGTVTFGNTTDAGGFSLLDAVNSDSGQVTPLPKKRGANNHAPWWMRVY